MSGTNQGRVLVSGVGIAGPTLAWWLSRWGFEVTLVETAPVLRTGGYMIDFWGVGYDVAERMGILPAILRDGYRIDEVRLVDSGGARVGGLDAGIFRAATADRFTSVLRGDLARHVYASLDGRVEVIFGDGIRALRQDDSGVDVTFGRSAPRRFDLVIGADGLHSAVRRLAFGAEDRFEYYLGYCTAAFSLAGYPRRDEGAYVAFCAPGRQVARYALRDGRTAFFFIFAEPSPPDIDIHDSAAHKTALRRGFGGLGWECSAILEAMDACEDLYFDSVSQIRLQRWSAGRVALVGDACFCPSLLAGQGAAFAMAGAYLLAGELHAAAGDHDAAFRAYEHRFKPFVDEKQKAATRFGGWFAPRTRLGIWLRNATTRLTIIPGVARWMAGRFVADRFRLPDYTG